MTPNHVLPSPRPHRARLLRWASLALAIGIFPACESRPEDASTLAGQSAPPAGQAGTPVSTTPLDGDPGDPGSRAPSPPAKVPAASRIAPAAPAPPGTVDFDDCALFRETPVFDQFRCKPRGLAIFRDPGTAGLEPAARWHRDLGRLYPADRWELSSPTELASAASSAALLQGLIRARQGAAELVVIAGTIEGGALAACMLPAALPNARTACQRSVETMQRGRLPPRDTAAPR